MGVNIEDRREEMEVNGGESRSSYSYGGKGCLLIYRSKITRNNPPTHDP